MITRLSRYQKQTDDHHYPPHIHKAKVTTSWLAAATQMRARIIPGFFYVDSLHFLIFIAIFVVFFMTFASTTLTISGLGTSTEYAGLNIPLLGSYP